ncbi:hypothetical protein AGLY_008915 [Aphis glycines]|uniref:Uncharacterized protein n=1 Tax=Aphis glycines TaxID=307491 RepID=A0A6G0TJY5_APHGL|nr:hypothetical protein AGLY_008915 [Aphis glycines]
MAGLQASAKIAWELNCICSQASTAKTILSLSVGQYSACIRINSEDFCVFFFLVSMYNITCRNNASISNFRASGVVSDNKVEDSQKTLLVLSEIRVLQVKKQYKYLASQHIIDSFGINIVMSLLIETKFCIEEELITVGAGISENVGGQNVSIIANKILKGMCFTLIFIGYQFSEATDATIEIVEVRHNSCIILFVGYVSFKFFCYWYVVLTNYYGIDAVLDTKDHRFDPCNVESEHVCPLFPKH